VVGAQAGLPDRQGALLQSPGTVQVALVAQDNCEVAEAVGVVGVVGSQARFINRLGALMERAGAVQIALQMQDNAEVVEGMGCFWVVGAQAGLPDRQGALKREREPSRSPCARRTPARSLLLHPMSGGQMPGGSRGWPGRAHASCGRYSGHLGQV